MKAGKQINPHPMEAKAAHLPKIQQAKAVKAQVKMAHPHKEMVDKAMAILKAVKVKVIPIVVRVKVMVAKVKAMATVMAMAEIPKKGVKAVLMAQVKVKVMATVKVKKGTATIVAVKVAKMLNVHSPKKAIVAKMVIPIVEIRTVKTEMVAIPTKKPTVFGNTVSNDYNKGFKK